MDRNYLSFEDKENTWDEVTDVIVVGGGFAGLTAAIEASNAGKSVIVFEKNESSWG